MTKSLLSFDFQLIESFDIFLSELRVSMKKLILLSILCYHFRSTLTKKCGTHCNIAASKYKEPCWRCKSMLWVVNSLLYLTLSFVPPPREGGGTLGISGWGCAAGTLNLHQS